MKNLLCVLFFLVFLFVSLFNISKLSASENKKYDLYFYKYSKLYFGYSIDYKWFKAQSIVESNLNPTAESPVGAKGLMQIMPGTWADVCKKQKLTTNITDPEHNIANGIYYDRYLWRNWKAKRTIKDRLCLMFASYNAGLGTILIAQKLCNESNTGLNCNTWTNIKQFKHRRWIHEETVNYVDRIFRFKSNLK